MQRISSKTTLFYKRVFPVFVIGFPLLVVTLVSLANWNSRNPVPLPVFLMTAGLGVFFFFVFRKLIFDLVDEVWDAGDMLVVRNKGLEDRILLSDIINVSYSQFVNPQRVTLMLRTPSQFGDKVSFSPPRASMFPLSSNPMVDELIRRVDAARRRMRYPAVRSAPALTPRRDTTKAAAPAATPSAAHNVVASTIGRGVPSAISP